MSHAQSESRDANDLGRVGFWSIFDHSRIPMALIDRNRRYVSVNDAVVELYEYPRDEILGRLAGRTSPDHESPAFDALWEQLVRSEELYGEQVVTHANGTHMDVSYAAHATTVGDRWLALVVTLSARFRPDGPELLGPAAAGSRNDKRSKLTNREREVVRMVALGSSTRGIAADLGLSFETVRTHVRNAMAKTGAHTRAQLVALVLADGLIDD
jgi:PAS domain S-box-containing protein